MRVKAICVAICMWAVAAAVPVLAQDTPEKGAAVYLSGLLVNDARDVLRDNGLPAEAAAAQAMVLLQFAAKQDGADVHTWRMLAEAARVCGKADLEKEALRKVIAADAGDLVSQVHYIDLLARAAQTVQERAEIYQNALKETSLDKQIRSEAAVRLGRLEEGRGDLAQARNYFTQAVQLNDVNVPALWGQVRLAPAGEQMRALATLLAADPYQPDAWLQLARLCQSAGVHDRAADFLEAGGEQAAQDGAPISGDFRLELAMEYGIAGQRVQGYGLAETLAELPDAPLGAMMVAEVLAQNLAATRTPLPLAGTRPATQAAFDRTAEIRKRLAELAKQTDSPSALADAAGADLTILATPGSNTAGWIDAYAKLVAPEDTTLARLRGWMLYRQGKLDDAAAALKKVAEVDPLARLGVARILIDQGEMTRAGDMLQVIWAGNPSGMLALQVALQAQRAKIVLVDSTAARTARTAMARLTPAVVGMYRSPRDSEYFDAHYSKDTGANTPQLGAGEPVLLQVRIKNISGRALPVGPEGVVKSTIGLAGATRVIGENNATGLGLYAIEDLQRVFRLEPQQAIDATIRVDQGKLADLLARNPETTQDVNVAMVTAPRVLDSQHYGAGVGGLMLQPGDFRRAGFPLSERLAQEVATLNGDKQLIRIAVAEAALAGAADEALKAKLSAALIPLTSAGDARVRATLVRMLPITGIRAELEKAVAERAQDSDPLVRLMWAARTGRMARSGGEAGTKAAEALRQQAASEKDEAVKQYLEAGMEAVKEKK